MKRTARPYAASGALALSLLVALGFGFPATAGEAESTNPAPAAASDAEFDGECVMGLALGKDIKTDCSVSTVYNGKKFCFGNETARTLFLKKPDEFLLQAHVYYSSKQGAPDAADSQPKQAE
jgi:YHS domain-containing protein